MRTAYPTHNPYTEEHRVSVRVPADVHKALRIWAAHQNVSVSAVIHKALETELGIKVAS
jgi:predicted HicB family RNase H-like nuclease